MGIRAGSTFLETAIRTLSPFTEMVLVVAGATAEHLRPIVDADGQFLIVNRHPERGQFSSLQIGLQEVLNRGRDAAILTLVDRPAPRPATIQKLRSAFLDSPPDVWAVVPQFDGKHGHPLVAGREMITAFLTAPAGSTGRDVEHANQAHIQYLDVDDPLVVWNVDTPEEYERILAGCP